MGWSLNRQNHPERPLWPREIISPRPRDRAPVGALPPSPEQRDKAVPLSKGVKPPSRAGNCRGLEAPGGLARWPLNPLLREYQDWRFGGYRQALWFFTSVFASDPQTWRLEAAAAGGLCIC
jgi:hypothetical protein